MLAFIGNAPRLFLRGKPDKSGVMARIVSIYSGIKKRNDLRGRFQVRETLSAPHRHAQRTAFRRRDWRLQSRLFARWNQFPGAPRFDDTGAILTRLFCGFAPDFPHYISGKEFKKMKTFIVYDLDSQMPVAVGEQVSAETARYCASVATGIFQANLLAEEIDLEKQITSEPQCRKLL